jgi:hypothetical protein
MGFKFLYPPSVLRSPYLSKVDAKGWGRNLKPLGCMAQKKELLNVYSQLNVFIFKFNWHSDTKKAIYGSFFCCILVLKC